MALTSWVADDPITEPQINAVVDGANAGNYVGITPVAGNTSSASCRFDDLDVVLMQGQMGNASGWTSGTTTTIGTIPAGMWPSRTWTFAAADTTSSNFRIVVTAAGLLRVTVLAGAPTAVFLDSLEWTTT